MTSKRRIEIDLTTEEDAKKLRSLEISLQDLPNELLITILKERSAREYIILSNTSKALAQRLQQIDNDMFRYYLKRDFKETISRDLDARTAYIVRARLPLLRFFKLTKLSESSADYDLFGRYFFRPSMRMGLSLQIANILEEVYPESIGVAEEIQEEEEYYHNVNNYELFISEQLAKKEGAWIPGMRRAIGGSSIAQIVRKLRTINLVDESDNATWQSQDTGIRPQMLTFLNPQLEYVNDDRLFRSFLQRDFDQTISTTMDAKTAYLLWQWHMRPVATHVVTVWQGYQREEPDEIVFKLFTIPKHTSLKKEAARALGPSPPDDRPDTILLRQHLHQYEAFISDDITKFLKDIGDSLDLPTIDDRFNLAFIEHVSGHTVSDIIRRLNA